MKDNKFYITTPIYYVNDVPHIGHAYTSLACDVIARFMRLNGKQVTFVTGTDEHGQKIATSAVKANKTPQELTDKTSQIFRHLLEKMNISNDDFIRTTEERHKIAVKNLWNKLKDSGNIYLGKYSGWYSMRDEAFYAESELTEDGKAPTGAEVEWLEEPSYFFALSKWQDKLLKFYDDHPDFIQPHYRRNEVINFVKSGLLDLSISRSGINWGIEVPEDEQHTIYVWLDALTNYLSVLGYPDKKYEEFWPADMHIVGKDILRFHAIYWPAFLMAAGIEMPKTIIAHGWWTNAGQKISKSIGNVIDPFALIDEFGLDQVRYFLMRAVPFGNDGNFSKEIFLQLNNSELSNKIGNLIQRVCTFTYKQCDQKIPNISKEYIDEIYQSDLYVRMHQMLSMNINYIAESKINLVLDNIIYLADKANEYMDHKAPWALKNDKEKMSQILYYLLELIRYIGIYLQPFTPDAAQKILDQLNISKNERQFMHLSSKYALIPGNKMQEPSPIFPRL